jgi:hypothetical protein
MCIHFKENETTRDGASVDKPVPEENSSLPDDSGEVIYSFDLCNSSL